MSDDNPIDAASWNAALQLAEDRLTWKAEMFENGTYPIVGAGITEGEKPELRRILGRQVRSDIGELRELRMRPVELQAKEARVPR